MSLTVCLVNVNSVSDHCRHERDCYLRANERDRMGWNGTSNEISGMSLLWKMPSMIVHEWQMRTGNTILSGHEQYFPFILSHFLVISWSFLCHFLVISWSFLGHFSFNYHKLSKNCTSQYCSLS
jgi:hypothetical protein